MKNNFGHDATTSFTMWFEHHLLEYGEAYQNFTGKLYYTSDERLPSDFYRYSSPYKQWVTESGVGGGAFVPTHVSGSAGKIDKKDLTNGYFFDFNNGGIVVTGNAASVNMNLSGSFSVKEFNIYNTNQTEEALIVESKFDSNSRFFVPESGIAPYDFVTPAVFINNEYIENEPFAFGGEDKTTLNFKSVVFAENLYQLDAILSLFADTRNSVIPCLDFSSHPINEYGDLKNGKYLYQDPAKKTLEAPFNIERVTTSKISETIRNTIAPGLFVGFLDFEITKPRFPRVC
jgi:hypothetical protein